MNKVANAAVRTGVALAVLLVPVLVSPQGAEKERVRQERPRARMAAPDILDITPEQQARLGELRKAWSEEQKAFREEMAKLREEGRELGKDPAANETRITALIDKSFKLRAELAKRSLKNRAARRAVFTPEQLEKMKNAREAFRARPRRPAPGRLGALRPGMGRMGAPRGRGFSRMGVRGRFGLWRRAPLHWRRW